MRVAWMIGILLLSCTLHAQEKACRENIDLGERALEAGDRESAASHFRAAKRAAGKMPPSLKRDGLIRRIFLRMKKADPLDIARSRAIKKSAEGLIKLARKYVKAGWLATAEELMTMATSIDPDGTAKELHEIRLRIRKLRRTGKEGLRIAIAGTLDWLARHRHPEGYWDCDGFGAECMGKKCRGTGYPLYDPGVTGLALLAFLGAGHTHETGKYSAIVKSGLAYLKRIQDRKGCFGVQTGHFMYSHCVAALAMCEAYQMTRSAQLQKPARVGLEFLLFAQNDNPEGEGKLAWRYVVRPGDNDTSVTGWAVSVLQTAKAAGLDVPAAATRGARLFLDKMTYPENGRIGYVEPGVSPVRAPGREEKWPRSRTEADTALGMAAKIYLGENPTSDIMKLGTNLILERLPAWTVGDGSIDHYYWYHATRALSLIGGKPWETWRNAIRPVLLEHQEYEGCERGSFEPAGPWGEDGGRVYSTAILAMCLGILQKMKETESR